MPAVIVSPSSSLASLACAPRIASFMGSAYQWQAAVGPAERVSFPDVPPLEEPFERFDELIHRTEIAMTKHPAGNDREPQLDLVEPRAMGRSVVKDQAVAVASIPRADKSAPGGVLVGIEVVEHQVDTSLTVIL